ncbi:MAG: polynucleotide 5'-hydroxyl-kinase [Nitrososphaerota archaeon]|nr:polynucleotide 5'-hydroxyl-kinase [Candidatus Calditenuaceae archaeon]MDW8073467.1 polynucleotide 5'-hydroxyl-kinase [Nitrososphaerota archaeon]
MLTESQSISLRPRTTLILKGPASARITEGLVEVFGCVLGVRERVVAKPWRSLPLHSEGGASVEVLLGAGGAAEVVEGCTIPPDWVEIASRLGERFRAIVIGGVDTGKTSLLTYIYNKRVSDGGIALVDLDVGQSELCPPTTMAIAMGSKPSPHLSSIKPSAIFPYGYTSPSYSTKHSLKTVRELASSIEGLGRTLINTDGWIDHERAKDYKAQLIRTFKPSHVIFIGVDDYGEMREACDEVGAEVVEIQEPRLVMRRDQDARRQIREMNYTRFFRGARLISTPRRWIRITPLLSASIPVEDYLRLLVKEMENAAVERAPLIEGLDMTEAGFGVLSYVNAQGRRAQSIALFMGVDGKGLARIYTPHEGPIQELEVGAMILSTSFKEVFTYLPPIE